MRSHARSALALAATAAAAVAMLLPAGAGAENPTLTGTVGPGFSISLVDATGARVKHLDPGTYTLVIHDLAEEHNFHLSGPGVNQFTEVETKGDVTWSVTFTAGTYTYVCDPHASVLSGAFTVGAVAPPAPSPTTTSDGAPLKSPAVGAGAAKAAAAKAVAAKAAAVKKAAAKAAAAKKAAGKTK